MMQTTDSEQHALALLELAIRQIPRRCCFCAANACDGCEKQSHWAWAGADGQAEPPRNARIKTPTRVFTELYAQGKTYKQIAQLLGCSIATVHNRLERAGVEARSAADYPPTDAQREARRLHCMGFSRRHGAESAQKQRETCRARHADTELGLKEYCTNGGYIRCYMPEHPAAASDGCVAKHRLVMERILGRYLTPDEVVHHINHDRADNRPENLQLRDRHSHSSEHGREGAAARIAKQKRADI